MTTLFIRQESVSTHLNLLVRTYDDMPSEGDWVLICDEWIEATLDQTVTYDAASKQFLGIHSIQARAERIYIFCSHYDDSIGKVIECLHPKGYEIVEVQS